MDQIVPCLIELYLQPILDYHTSSIDAWKANLLSNEVFAVAILECA